MTEDAIRVQGRLTPLAGALMKLRVLVIASVLAGCSPSNDEAEDEDQAARSQFTNDGGIPADAPMWFTEEAAARGITGMNHTGDPVNKRYLVEEIGNGCALFDFDNDGDLDLYVVDGCRLLPAGQEPAGVPVRLLPPHTDSDHLPAFDGQSRLYENDGRGFFRDVTEESGTSYQGFGCGVSAADYDNDGDADLYLTCWGPNRLLRNDGAGRFTDVTEQAGVGDPHWSVGSCWLDFDLDGHLDLFVANYFSLTTRIDPEIWNKVDCPYLEITASCGPKTMVPEPDTLYHSRGDGTFEDVSEEQGIRNVEPSYGLGAIAFDYDRDGRPDLYVANDSRPNHLFRRQDRVFKEVADLTATALNSAGIAQAGMGIACGDYDSDGDLDLHLTNFSHDTNTLYRNETAADFDRFTDVTMRMSFGRAVYFSLGWGTEFVDFDLDGDLDLFTANGHVYPEADSLAPDLSYRQQSRLHANVGERFADVTADAGTDLQKPRASRGAAFGDVDRDGDVDVVVVGMNEPPSLLINRTPRRGRHFAVVSLEGRRCNRPAIGTQIFVTASGRTTVHEVRAGHSFASCNDPRIHLGLAAADRIERLEVVWPGGERREFTDLPVDVWIHIRQDEDSQEVRPWTIASKDTDR